MSKEQLQQIIFPWQSYYDEQYSQYYYFNPLTNESVWELPQQLLKKVEEALKQKNEQEQEAKRQENDQDNDKEKSDEKQNNENNQNKEQKQDGGEPLYEKQDFDQSKIKNMEKFLSEEKLNQRTYDDDIIHLMKRPARKQQDGIANKDVAYTQGGLEYNIWYGRHLTDSRDKGRVREKAKTRCDPDLDTGYTKADLFDKQASYFCMHFARGQCCEGSKCKYFHRVPSMEECQSIDGTRDIFGRPRFAQMREDMGGIGSFQNETRTVMVSEFKMPRGDKDGVQLMYEIIWRHFSIYGTIEDITIKPAKGWAFIRFAHRSMAEFAKECMMNQELDNKEMILVRWAADDEKNPIEVERRRKEDLKLVKEAIDKKESERILQEQNEMLQMQRDIEMKKELQEKLLVQQEEEKRKNQIQENVEKMNSILDKLDDNEEEQEQEKQIDIGSLL